MVSPAFAVSTIGYTLESLRDVITGYKTSIRDVPMKDQNYGAVAFGNTT